MRFETISIDQDIIDPDIKKADPKVGFFQAIEITSMPMRLQQQVPKKLVRMQQEPKLLVRKRQVPKLLAQQRQLALVLQQQVLEQQQQELLVGLQQLLPSCCKLPGKRPTGKRSTVFFS